MLTCNRPADSVSVREGGEEGGREGGREGGMEGDEGWEGEGTGGR